MNWVYGVSIVPFEEGGFVVSVRDLPEVLTFGDDLDEAIKMAEDAIFVIVAGRVRDESNLNLPTPVLDGEYAVPLRAQMAAKASIYALWKEAGLSKSELARRLNRSETEVRRLLNPDHGTKLNQISEAAQALGGTLVVGLAS